jgi:hypothetical protein
MSNVPALFNNTDSKEVPNFEYYLKQTNVDSPPSLVIRTFSTKEITSIIKVLKTKNPYGFDEISNNLLKISAKYICSPLTHICNKSILSGNFPDQMKYSVVKPIHKKGDKMNPANYRPVSLLATFAKVLEKALYIRLIGHFNTHQLLVDNQFGFRKGTATEDAIYKLTNEILNASNNKTLAGSIFCDLEKVFDSVDI